MQCDEIEELLYLHRAGELEPGEHQILTDHLKTCSACREMLAELKQLDTIFDLERSVAPDLGRDLDSDILSAIYAAVQESDTGSMSKLIPHWLTERALWFALVVFLGILGISFATEQYIAIKKITTLEEKMVDQAVVSLQETSLTGRLAGLYSRYQKRNLEIGTGRGKSILLSKLNSTDVATGAKFLRLSDGVHLVGTERKRGLLSDYSGIKTDAHPYEFVYQFLVQEEQK